MTFTIISRYLLRSFLGPFLTGLLFFTFIILVFYLKEIIRSAVEKGVPASMVLELLSYSMGWTLGLTVPMAVLMAVIMTIGALNADSEVIAMRAGGITYGRILRPFLVFGGVLTVFLIWFNQSVIPFCIREMQILSVKILNHDPIAIIEQGQFTKLDKSDNMERHIYIENIDKRGRLINIQIRKTENKGEGFFLSEMIFAREGERIRKPGTNGKPMKALRLYRGYIFSRNRGDGTFQRIDFTRGRLDLNLFSEMDETKIQVARDKQSLSPSELSGEINKQEKENPKLARELRLEYHKRIALPFAVMALMFLGFPLGIVNRRSGKGMGFGASIIFIFAYYVVFLSADAISVQAELMPPLLAAWLANLLIAAIGGYIFYSRTADSGLIFYLQSFTENIRARIKRS